MAGKVLEGRAITKSFGRTSVLRGVDLELGPGDRYMLFGPNGSGKTTLVRVLSGLLDPDSGEVRVFGASYREPEEGDDIRSRVGFLSHEPFLYGELTAAENLDFFGRLYSVPDRAARVKAMLKEVGLYARAFDRVDTFSRGMKQRLGLARALLHDPDLVLLDEPYTGLDLRATAILDRLIGARAAEGKAFLCITHDLEGGLRLATRAGLLSKGSIVLEARAPEWGGLVERYRDIMGGEGQ
jgi:heme exporter protein A